MRLRNVPGSREFIAASEHVIPEESLPGCRGRWKEIFGSDHPIYIEIGTGKGRFITEMAKANPSFNYIGVEKYSSVLIKAIKKLDALPDIRNLIFLRMDAEYITDVFGPGEIAGIYLNFSDPWPKDRHAKRRLPGREFLARYRQILADGGRVEFKTDNQELFSFAVQAAHDCDYTVLACTRDLHHDRELCAGNIMTEYEEKFSSLGNPICKLIITP